MRLLSFSKILRIIIAQAGSTQLPNTFVKAPLLSTFYVISCTSTDPVVAGSRTDLISGNQPCPARRGYAAIRNSEICCTADSNGTTLDR